MRKLIVGFAFSCPSSARRPLRRRPGGRRWSSGWPEWTSRPTIPIRLHGYRVRTEESAGRRPADLGQGAGDRLGRPSGPSCSSRSTTWASPTRSSRRSPAAAERQGGDPPRSVRRRLVAHPQRPLPDGRRAEHLRQAASPTTSRRPIDRYTRELTDKLEEGRLAALKPTAGPAGSPGPRAGSVRGQPADARGARSITPARAPGHRPRRHAPRRRGQLRLPLHDDRPEGEQGQRRLGRLRPGGDRADHPGAIALTVIGCGADANPTPRVDPGAAAAHGRAIADEVEPPAQGPAGPPLAGAPRSVGPDAVRASLRHPADPRRARSAGQGRRAARLQRLGPARQARPRRAAASPSSTTRSRPGSSATSLRWSSSPGEVVVDYVLRLKKEFDAGRLWVTAYANDVPCYIPSERILREGGYEGGGAMVYYARPDPAQAGDRGAHHRRRRTSSSPRSSRPPSGPTTRTPPPKSPGRVACGRIRDQAGAAGRARGRRAAGRRPGRDRLRRRRQALGLRDARLPHRASTATGSPAASSRCSRTATATAATTPPRSSSTACRSRPASWPGARGSSICAAPEILYAEDTDGDGKADVRRTLFQGLRHRELPGPGQRPVLRPRQLGLRRQRPDRRRDPGHGHRARGRHRRPRLPDQARHGRDGARLGPDPARAGPRRLGQPVRRQQQHTGSSTTPCPTTTPGATRASPPPAPSVVLSPRRRGRHRLFPASRTLDRFNEPESANRVTSACSP